MAILKEVWQREKILLPYLCHTFAIPELFSLLQGEMVTITVLARLLNPDQISLILQL